MIGHLCSVDPTAWRPLTKGQVGALFQDVNNGRHAVPKYVLVLDANRNTFLLVLPVSQDLQGLVLWITFPNKVCKGLSDESHFRLGRYSPTVFKRDEHLPPPNRQVEQVNDAIARLISLTK